MPPSDPFDDHAGHLLYWCARLVRSFAEAGVNRAFISPGSRSTPLTFAVAGCPHISSKIVLDERSAGFQALGAVKASGVPALLICTSGTAAANYYPAVIEARQSGTPLIVCSADRTPLERNTGANQTINQLNLYGTYPVFFHDAGEPGNQKRDYDRAEMLAQQAVQQSMEQGGPVHLNFPFRKPLEPSARALDELKDLYKNIRLSDSGYHAAGKAQLPDWLTGMIREARNAVALCGPIAPSDPMIDSVNRLADQTGIPVWVESTSLHAGAGNRFPAASQWVDELPLQPDLILRFGGLPTSRGMLNWLQEAEDIPQVLLRSDSRSSEIPGGNNLYVQAAGGLDWDSIPSQTGSEILKASDQALTEYSSRWQQLLSNTHEFTDLHVADAVLHQTDSVVMLSNSLIVRDTDRVPLQNGPAKIISNRGASGIDGITSTALGVAECEDQTTLLTGDLAFLHDLTALNSADQQKVNLHIIIINNGGGRIFRMLPFDQYDERFRQLFETPQTTQISELCHAFGISHHAVHSMEALNERLTKPPETGIRVTECITDGLKSDELRKS